MHMAKLQVTVCVVTYVLYAAEVYLSNEALIGEYYSEIQFDRKKTFRLKNYSWIEEFI